MIRYFSQNVYPGQRQPGEVNTLRLEKVQNFYRARGIINAATPLRELYATLPSA